MLWGTKNDAMAAVESGLKERGWKFMRPDAQTVITGVRSQTGRHYLIAIRWEEGRQTLAFMINPSIPPGEAAAALESGTPPILRVHSSTGHSAEQIAALTSLLLGINYRTLLGNFERDDRDGEVRYRVTLPYRDAGPTPAQVNWCLDMGLTTLENSMQAIDAIVSGGKGHSKEKPSGPTMI